MDLKVVAVVALFALPALAVGVQAAPEHVGTVGARFPWNVTFTPAGYDGTYVWVFAWPEDMDAHGAAMFRYDPVRDILVKHGEVPTGFWGGNLVSSQGGWNQLDLFIQGGKVYFLRAWNCDETLPSALSECDEWPDTEIVVYTQGTRTFTTESLAWPYEDDMITISVVTAGSTAYVLAHNQHGTITGVADKVRLR